MDEKKFSVCDLAVTGITLKVAALKNELVKNLLKNIRMNNEDLSEKSIALELDDLYEFAVLMEPDDEDNGLLDKLIQSLMKELPNVEEYKKKYNWNFLGE